MPINIKPAGHSLSIDELTRIQEQSENLGRPEPLPVTSPVKKESQTTTSSNADQIENKPVKNRFYLPVLYINDASQWESKPVSERQHFTDEVAKNTCIGNCCGIEGLSAGCCQLDPDDLEHVLGPVDEEWINKTIKWFKKRDMSVTRHDIVIDYEEGKLIGQKFFHDHEVFKRKDTYPILRIQASGIRFACKFLNVQTGKCTIYLQRPEMCRNYYCSYIKSNFLLKTKENSNTWKKIQ